MNSTTDYTNANAAIWLAELLIYYHSLEYSGQRSFTKWQQFFCFNKVLKEPFDTNG